VRTPLKAGDRYDEHTAYVVFHCDTREPLSEFLAWDKKLRNPLSVAVIAK
jgi:hypothetical protein